jgi:hypothetical protein
MNSCRRQGSKNRSQNVFIQPKTAYH